uniref:Uncharacterized protein n=1 Tax=Timema poppense TaxID=170557 RepID=A0A7R9HHG4_TIMPO|nr:unnamed protein product [Timema poppensis]
MVSPLLQTDHLCVLLASQWEDKQVGTAYNQTQPVRTGSVKVSQMYIRSIQDVVRVLSASHPRDEGATTRTKGRRAPRRDYVSTQRSTLSRRQLYD